MDFKKRMAEEIEEMLRHKYIESEKAGRDLGDECLAKWPSEHGEAWRIGFNQRNMMDLGDGRKPVYFGIFLDTESANKLKDTVADILPPDWTVYCHHCTLSFGDPSPDPEVFNYIAQTLGTMVTLDAVTLGISEEAIAVGVTGNIKARNETPHITVATAPGVPPVRSNAITEWKPLPEGLRLTGIVDAFPSHFGWKH
jgi:hypothetical protein